METANVELCSLSQVDLFHNQLVELVDHIKCNPMHLNSNLNLRFSAFILCKVKTHEHMNMQFFNITYN